MAIPIREAGGLEAFLFHRKGRAGLGHFYLFRLFLLSATRWQAILHQHKFKTSGLEMKD